MNKDKSDIIARLGVLAFGIFTLLFLVAIDRQQWFQLKPATESARAMVLGSDQVRGGIVSEVTNR